MATQVGMVTRHIAELLNVRELAGKPILLGDSNVQHMQSSHPADYEKYGVQLGKILESPDYVAINRKDNSLEYVKECHIL